MPVKPTTAFDATKIARLIKAFAVFTHTVGFRQAETATAVGAITTSGNLSATITGSGIAGTPVTLSVAVLNGDSPAVWAAKVRAAIIANGAISAVVSVVPAADATIGIQKLAAAANDNSLNIALANDTSAGATAAATSAHTTVGVAVGATANLVGKVVDLDGKTTVIDRKIPDAAGILRADIHFATEGEESVTLTDIEEIDSVLAFLGGLTGLVHGTVQFFLIDPRDAAGYVRFLSDNLACAVQRDGTIKGDNAVSKNPTLKFLNEKSSPITWSPAGAVT